MLLQAASSIAQNMPIMATDTTAVLTTSAVSVWLIQKLKQASWFKVITPSTTTLNRLASILAALFAATGIHFAFDDGTGTFTVTGLALATIIPAFVGWFKAFVMNELIYQGIVNKIPPKA